MSCSCGCHICCAASCVFPCDQLVCIVCSFAYVTRVPMWMWYECCTPAHCSLGWGKREGLVAGEKDRQMGVEWTEQSQAEPRTQLEGSGGRVLLGGVARAGSGLGASNTHIPTHSHSYTHSPHTQIRRHSCLPTGPWWLLSSPSLPVHCSVLRAWHPLPWRTEPMRSLPAGDLPGRGRPAQLLPMSQRRRTGPSGCPQRVGVWRWVQACGGIGGTGTPKLLVFVVAWTH